MTTLKKQNIKVRNMISGKGNLVDNQYIIITNEGVYFQSYSTIIAFQDNAGKVFLDSNKWDYSKTTGKYRNEFLNETKKETLKKIESKEYTLINLN